MIYESCSQLQRLSSIECCQKITVFSKMKDKGKNPLWPISKCRQLCEEIEENHESPVPDLDSNLTLPEYNLGILPL
jgi:hypothetical protein